MHGFGRLADGPRRNAIPMGEVNQAWQRLRMPFSPAWKTGRVSPVRHRMPFWQSFSGLRGAAASPCRRAAFQDQPQAGCFRPLAGDHWCVSFCLLSQSTPAMRLDPIGSISCRQLPASFGQPLRSSSGAGQAIRMLALAWKTGRVSRGRYRMPFARSFSWPRGVAVKRHRFAAL